jgi:hypothetical protein
MSHLHSAKELDSMIIQWLLMWRESAVKVKVATLPEKGMVWYLHASMRAHRLPILIWNMLTHATHCRWLVRTPQAWGSLYKQSVKGRVRNLCKALEAIADNNIHIKSTVVLIEEGTMCSKMESELRDQK